MKIINSLPNKNKIISENVNKKGNIIKEKEGHVRTNENVDRYSQEKESQEEIKYENLIKEEFDKAVDKLNLKLISLGTFNSHWLKKVRKGKSKGKI